MVLPIKLIVTPILNLNGSIYVSKLLGTRRPITTQLSSIKLMMVVSSRITACVYRVLISFGNSFLPLNTQC